MHECHKDVNVEDRPVGDPNKPKKLILAFKHSCGLLFVFKVNKQNHNRIVHPEKSKIKIKSLMFNTYGVTDEYNSPTASVS